MLTPNVARWFMRFLVVFILSLLVVQPAACAGVKKGSCDDVGQVKRQKGCQSDISTGTDYTADDNAIGCWLIFSGTGEVGAEADRCPAGGTDNMSYNGSPFATDTTVPAGTASGQQSVALDGTGDYFSLADQDEFESADFSVGCWGLANNKFSQRVLISKNDVSAWEVYLKATSGTVTAEVNNVVENSSEGSAGVWWNVVVRYDGTGSHVDAEDDKIEIFINGVKDCQGGCASSSDPIGNSDDLIIGWASPTDGGGNAWQGGLFECFYMNDVLSDTQVCEIMLCGMNGTANGPLRDANYGRIGCDCSNINTCC